MRLFLLLALSFPSLVNKNPEPQWKTGKVLYSRLAKSSVAVGSTTSTNSMAAATGSEGLARLVAKAPAAQEWTSPTSATTNS
jgi:hypothetical protein